MKSTKTVNNETQSILYADGIEFHDDQLNSIMFEEGRVVYNKPLDGTDNSPYIEWD